MDAEWYARLGIVVSGAVAAARGGGDRELRLLGERLLGDGCGDGLVRLVEDARRNKIDIPSLVDAVKRYAEECRSGHASGRIPPGGDEGSGGGVGGGYVAGRG